MKSLIIASFLFASSAMAGFTVPAMPNPVNDYANVLSDSGKESIAQQIVNLKQETQAQLGVLIVNTLDGDSIEDASMRAAKTWKLGDKRDSDGILLLVAIKDHKMRIEVGTGLESTVTDARSKQILASMKSALRSGNFDGAIQTGVDGISSTVKAGKADIQHASPTAPTKESSNTLYVIITLLGLGGLVAFLVSRSNKKEVEEEKVYQSVSRNRRGNQTVERSYSRPARDDSSDAIVAAAVLSSSRSRRDDDDSSSSRSSWSSSDSSSSSSSSSDWGGGGGDFSGGGSSDSW